MIISTVAVVKRDYDCHAFPLPQPLEGVNHFDQERLLVEGIRDSSRTSALVTLRFNIAHRRQVAGLCCEQQVVEVVLVVCGPGMPDLGDTRRPPVTEIAGL